MPTRVEGFRIEDAPGGWREFYADDVWLAVSPKGAIRHVCGRLDNVPPLIGFMVLDEATRRQRRARIGERAQRAEQRLRRL